MRRPSLTWLAPLGVLALAFASCTYDFDAAFSDTPTVTGSGATGGSTPTGSGGGTAGTGGAGLTAGSGGIAGAGGQGTGAQAAGETCDNNFDDDGDQAVDCADPDCQADWECAVPAPAGWEGPVAVYVGDPSQVPTCAPTWDEPPLEGGTALDAPAAICNPCGCDAPDISCSIGDVDLYAFNGCGNWEHELTPPAAGSCYPFSYGGGDLSAAIGHTGTPQPGASCAENGGGVQSVPAYTWTEAALLCRGDLVWGGCGTNLCAPRPDGTFRRCVFIAGPASCSFPYTDELTIFTTVQDTRDCSDCACGSPTDIVCGGTTELWEDAGCGGAPQMTVAHDDNCESNGLLNNPFDGSYQFTENISYTPCASSGGESTGQATAETPYTVCCLPQS